MAVPHYAPSLSHTQHANNTDIYLPTVSTDYRRTLSFCIIPRKTVKIKFAYTSVSGNIEVDEETLSARLSDIEGTGFVWLNYAM